MSDGFALVVLGHVAGAASTVKTHLAHQVVGGLFRWGHEVPSAIGT